MPYHEVRDAIIEVASWGFATIALERASRAAAVHAQVEVWLKVTQGSSRS